jgi:hypothetical protein
MDDGQEGRLGIGGWRLRLLLAAETKELDEADELLQAFDWEILDQVDYLLTRDRGHAPYITCAAAAEQLHVVVREHIAKHAVFAMARERSARP